MLMYLPSPLSPNAPRSRDREADSSQGTLSVVISLDCSSTQKGEYSSRE